LKKLAQSDVERPEFEKAEAKSDKISAFGARYSVCIIQMLHVMQPTLVRGIEQFQRPSCWQLQRHAAEGKLIIIIINLDRDLDTKLRLLDLIIFVMVNPGANSIGPTPRS
jgi:hypothetical protein